MPELEPVPRDHVVTKTFYLIDGFVGRTTNGQTWIEALPPPEPNDGAASGARRRQRVADRHHLERSRRGLGAGSLRRAALPARLPAAARQREMALRGGVNLVMYTLTGNYKADQVHVRDLLERLGALNEWSARLRAARRRWPCSRLLAVVGCRRRARSLARAAAARLCARSLWLLLLLALADPSLVREDREPLKDVVAVVLDHIGIQSIGERAAQTTRRAPNSKSASPRSTTSSRASSRRGRAIPTTRGRSCSRR